MYSTVGEYSWKGEEQARGEEYQVTVVHFVNIPVVLVNLSQLETWFGTKVGSRQSIFQGDCHTIILS